MFSILLLEAKKNLVTSSFQEQNQPLRKIKLICSVSATQLDRVNVKEKYFFKKS